MGCEMERTAEPGRPEADGPGGRPAMPYASRRAVLGTALAAVTLAAAGAVTGCESSGSGSGSGSRGDQDRSPFTGGSEKGDHVLAVKIDNVDPARPQTGLDQADLVYTEEVEAGLSRILAVFASRVPASVGPVRSARESDLELLRQFGRPALAFSGVQSKLMPTLEAAPLRLVPPGKLGDGYERDPSRPAPHNLYLRARTAVDAAKDASAPRDIGFRFGPAPDGGRRVGEHSVRYPAARFSFNWSADRRRWLVSMDGAPAHARGDGRLAPATVVVQYVTARASRFRDSSGSVTPYTETVGQGRALVLRDGKEYRARWSRPSADRGTIFTDSEGHRLPFARGQVWTALVPKD